MTLKQVARAAGVSTASASRVLRGGYGVSSDLRTRVMAAAVRLGYRPNLAARALASRLGGVGIVVADMSDPLLVAVAKAVASQLAERGVRSFVTWVPGAGVHTHGPDGRPVSAWVRVGGLPTAREQLPGAIPCVGISDGPGQGGRTIELGRLRGLTLACRYLENEGHRSVAAVAPPDVLAARRFVDTLGDEAFFPEPVGAGPTGVNEAMRRVLQGKVRPTAIVCDSDVAALAALRCCAAEGMSVPGQISVVGFGDEPFARHSVPALTTVRVSAEPIGATAADAILDLAAGRDPSFQATAVKLVLRESSGPAP